MPPLPPLPFGYDEAAFSRDIISRWGHIRDGITYDKARLHSQMGHLARLCQAHPEIAPEIFQFLEELLARKDAISEIENAVAISFLDWQEMQRLGFSERLPAKLAATIKDQWERDQRLT